MSSLSHCANPFFVIKKYAYLMGFPFNCQYLLWLHSSWPLALRRASRRARNTRWSGSKCLVHLTQHHLRDKLAVLGLVVANQLHRWTHDLWQGTDGVLEHVWLIYEKVATVEDTVKRDKCMLKYQRFIWGNRLGHKILGLLYICNLFLNKMSKVLVTFECHYEDHMIHQIWDKKNIIQYWEWPFYSWNIITCQWAALAMCIQVRFNQFILSQMISDSVNWARHAKFKTHRKLPRADVNKYSEVVTALLFYYVYLMWMTVPCQKFPPIHHFFLCCSHLSNVVITVLATDGLDSTDIQPSKELWAGINPQLIPATGKSSV